MKLTAYLAFCYDYIWCPLEDMTMIKDSSLEQFVTQQLQSGKYQSYEEMVEAGLRLLQECEAELDHIADKLRPAVEEFLSGHPSVPFDAEEIIKRGKERLASEQQHS